MAKKLLALFDTDLEYVNRFMDFVKGKRNLPFKVAGFSETGPLMDFINRTPVDILLMSEDTAKKPSRIWEVSENTDSVFQNIFQEDGEKMTIFEQFLEELRKVPNIGEIIILGERQNNKTHKRVINKYQSAEAIISEITECLDVEQMSLSNPENEDLEIVAVFSPEGGLNKSNFSLCLANAASKNKSVLYVNLERFSGLKTLLGISNDISMSDIIYYYKTNTSKIREGLTSSAMAIGNFHCLTAPLDIEDLDIIGDENWMDFLKTIGSIGGYDCIVVDMDEAIKKINIFFEICRTVYVPTVPTLMAEKKIEEFKDYLKLCDKERILEKIVEVNIGENRSETILPEDNPQNYLQNCFLGKMQVIANKAYCKGVENGA